MLKKIGFIVLSMFIIVGCTDYRGAQQISPDSTTEGQRFGLMARDQINQSNSLELIIDNQDRVELEVYSQNAQTYLSLATILESLGYLTIEENENGLQAGFIDILHEIKRDSKQAIVDGEPVTLSSPVITVNEQTYISTNSLQQFLGTTYEVKFANNSLNINIVEEDFGFIGNEDLSEIKVNEEEDIPTVSAAMADRIIRTGRKYLGTPYVFGASTRTTKVFDCSSFTKRVYGTHGIYLPRTSRAQARQGKFVPVSQLRKGDLLFFYWPGRYKSNKIVGHVGIYMGNGYVLQATPNKGVHIANAAKSSYWRKVYLGAKRVG